MMQNLPFVLSWILLNYLLDTQFSTAPELKALQHFPMVCLWAGLSHTAPLQTLRPLLLVSTGGWDSRSQDGLWFLQDP